MLRSILAAGLIVAACAQPRTATVGPISPTRRTDSSSSAHVAVAPSRTARVLGARVPATRASAARAPATPFLRDIVQLSVGFAHVCAVTTKHAVVCWGDNAVGQLGVGKNGRAVSSSSARPHFVGGLPRIESVSSGAMHTCALDDHGNVFCWGNEGGDLVVTDGSTTGSVDLRGEALGTPVKMPLGEGKAHLVAVASRGRQACAAFADEVRCWDTFRTIPINARTIPAPDLQRTKLVGVTALAIGHGTVCAIARQQLSCWRGEGRPTPAVWERGDAIAPIEISIGEMYACVSSAKGEARCWWSLIDEFWKKPPNRNVQWSGKTATRAIAVGDSPVCTVDVAGKVDCFMSDEGGLMDDAANASWATTSIGPHKIAGIDHAIDVGLGQGRNAMGYGFGCALRSSPDTKGAQVFCWGDNDSGQLGTGNHKPTRAAARVLSGTGG